MTRTQGGHTGVATTPAWAWGMLPLRFVQGWIYWGGGSRRFIYAPAKLNAWGGGHWMAYKFQTAMPGALFGLDHVISYMLQHFALLYGGVILFSLFELVVGLMLIAGLATRLAALGSIALSFVLMLMFGWQGATCIDEWTMAACNFAMGMALFFAGGGAYSCDALWRQRRPAMSAHPAYDWCLGDRSLPLAEQPLRRLALFATALTVLFVVGTYDHYRGSVYSAFHPGPVSPTHHHWSLRSAQLASDGAVRFHAYVDAGTPEAASQVLRIRLRDASGRLYEVWSGDELAHLPASSYVNDYAYQKIHRGPFGIIGPVGAKAWIRLPGHLDQPLPQGHYVLSLAAVDGQVWRLDLQR